MGMLGGDHQKNVSLIEHEVVIASVTCYFLPELIKEEEEEVVVFFTMALPQLEEYPPPYPPPTEQTPPPPTLYPPLPLPELKPPKPPDDPPKHTPPPNPLPIPPPEEEPITAGREKKTPRLLQVSLKQMLPSGGNNGNNHDVEYGWKQQGHLICPGHSFPGT